MLFYLYGPDSYRSTMKLKEIREKFIREVDPQSLNIAIIDGATADADMVRQQICAAPFLASKRLIIIKQLISTSKKKETPDALLDTLKERAVANATDVIVVFWEPVNPGSGKKSSKLHEYLAKQKLAQEFAELSPVEVERWIAGEMKTRTAAIGHAALRSLASRVGPDLWRLESEVSKLAHYCAGRTIEEADVEELTRTVFDESIFDLIDSIGLKQRAKALTLLTRHIGAGEHELGILAMMQRHFKNLLLVRDACDRTPSISKDAVAKELAIHPFVAQKALAQARAYTGEQLRELSHRLIEIEYAAKRGADAELLLDLMIATL